MVTIIRDRVRDLIKAGHDAGPDQGGGTGQGIHTAVRRGLGSWTTNQFIEAVYQSLLQEKS